MIPLRDYHKLRIVPFVNYTIILINIIVFLIEISIPDLEVFAQMYGFVPNRFDVFNLLTYRDVFSSLWIHGGWFHLVSNMWFLHIFGDNIENKLGHTRYIVFYVMAGVISVLVQYVVFPESTIPLIGASGAISGVAGAYFVLFRKSSIKTLVPTFFGLWHIIRLPVWFFLGYWFFLQVFSGIGSLSAMQNMQGGVAFFAHIGGFIFGYIFAKKV